MKKGELSGNWKVEKTDVKVQLPVMVFLEDKAHIAYIPVLDLSGYGNSEKEALDSLDIVLNDYFSYGIRKKTLLDDLKAHGWKIEKKSKPYIAPDITDILNKNEYLHDIVNSRPYKMDRIDVNMPQLA